MGPALILVNVAIVGRGNFLGKKKGHLYIQVGYDMEAEKSGLAAKYIGAIKKMATNNDYDDNPRKGNQVYSIFSIKIF